MAVDLKRLVGKRALVQFREDYLVAGPVRALCEIDVLPTPIATRTWPVLVGERDGEVVLVYDSADGSRAMVLRVSPDLVAFATVCDDQALAAAPEAPPEAT